MRPLALRPTLVEQTYEAILNGICDGTVPLNTQLVQAVSYTHLTLPTM